jgi:hypothetical protein
MGLAAEKCKWHSDNGSEDILAPQGFRTITSAMGKGRRWLPRSNRVLSVRFPAPLQHLRRVEPSVPIALLLKEFLHLVQRETIHDIFTRQPAFSRDLNPEPEILQTAD